MNNPGRYKLHQYLKYAHQWADTVSYKCRLYLILDNGKIGVAKRNAKDLI